MKILDGYNVIGTLNYARKNQFLYTILIHGTELIQDNINTFLYEDILPTDLSIKIVGEYANYIGYLVIDDEILHITGTSFDITYSTLAVTRGKLKSRAKSHTTKAYVRTVKNFTEMTVSYTYSNKSDVSDSNLFAPILVTSNIQLNDDVKNWMVYSFSKKYKLNNSLVCYIFEGLKSEIICRYVGFYDTFKSDTVNNIIYINFASKLKLWWNKKIDKVKQYSMIKIKPFLQDLLGIDLLKIKYSTDNYKTLYGDGLYGDGAGGGLGIYGGNTVGLTDTAFFDIYKLSTNEFDTYGQLLQTICKELCFRMTFNSNEDLVLFTEAKKLDIFTAMNLTENNDLMTIENNSDDLLIINQVKSEYKLRIPFNTQHNAYGNDYVGYRYFSIKTGINILKAIDNHDGTYSYEFNPIENIIVNSSAKLKIGDYVLLVDNYNLSMYFYGKVLESSGIGINILLGFDLDRNTYYYGKLDKLYTLGYINPHSFSIFYTRQEMPYIYKYTRQVGDKIKNIDIRYPILGGESYVFYGKTDVSSDNGLAYAGFSEQIEGIFDTVFDYTTLKYNQEIVQTVPIYLYTNKIEPKGVDKKQYYVFNSWDNTNVNVLIERSDKSDEDFKITVTNTFATETPTTYTPINTIARILQVDSMANYNCGDVLMLHPDNNNDPNTKTIYNNFKETKYLVVGKFKDTTSPYNEHIILDINYPIGNNDAQFKFNHWTYLRVVMLNGLHIRGAPVMEETHTILEYNEESQNIYGIHEYEITGKYTYPEDIKYIVTYLLNSCNATDSTSVKFQLPFDLLYNFKLENLDVVTIHDDIYTGLNNQKMLITEQTVNYTLDNRTEKYNCINLNDFNTAPLIIKYKLKTIYSSSTEVMNDSRDVNILVSSKYLGGKSIKKIEIEMYNARVEVISGAVLIIYNIQGGKKDPYNIEVIGKDMYAVIKIKDEFLLILNKNDIDVTTSEIQVEIIERGFLNTLEIEILKDFNIQFYEMGV